MLNSTFLLDCIVFYRYISVLIFKLYSQHFSFCVTDFIEMHSVNTFSTTYDAALNKKIKIKIKNRSYNKILSCCLHILTCNDIISLTSENPLCFPIIVIVFWGAIMAVFFKVLTCWGVIGWTEM